MCPLTNSTNFITLKPIISKDMALAKVVPCRKRRESRRTVWILVGGKLSCVVCGMTTGAAIRPQHVSSGISVRFATDHIAKVPALAKGAPSSKVQTHHQTCWPSGIALTARDAIAHSWSKFLSLLLTWYPGSCAIYWASFYFKPPRNMLGAAKK